MPKTWSDLMKISRAEKIPADFKSTDEIAKETGKSHDHARQLLMKAAREGLVERREFNAVVPGTSTPRRRAYWKLIGDAK